MEEPNLEIIFKVEEGDVVKTLVQYEKNNGDLYINGKKVAYDLKLTPFQKIITYSVSFAICIDALMSVLTFIYRCN